MLPTFVDIESAAGQIAGTAHHTPVATSRTMNARTGAELFFKCENLQRAGAFKFRGAYNALSRLAPDARRRGVVTFSSGNHAQAIALAGQLLDIPRVIVMPADAPAVKRRATEEYGGEIVLYDRDREDREATAWRMNGDSRSSRPTITRTSSPGPERRRESSSVKSARSICCSCRAVAAAC
jgi:threonine dehydratase